MAFYRSFSKALALLPFHFLQLACNDGSGNESSKKAGTNAAQGQGEREAPAESPRGEERRESSERTDEDAKKELGRAKAETRPTTRSMEPKEVDGSSMDLRPSPGTEKFRERFDQSPQQYEIPLRGDTVIHCENGTELHFPYEPFVTLDGKAIEEGPVRIQVKEYYDSEDILLAGLETKSGERPLGTGGMVHIDAKADGKDCRSKDGKEIGIGFPRKEGQRGMKLFAGERKADGGMDWEIESETDLNSTYSADELDQEASFPGGEESKAGYLREKTPYPAPAQAQGREGIVRIGVEVAKDGSLDDPVLLDSVAPSLNRAAFETVREMPSWIPAKKEGRRVRSRTTIEVRFQLGEAFDEEKEAEPMSPEELEEKMEQGGELSSAGQEAVSDYLFQSSEMRGWHNCDRFLEEMNFKEYTVKLEETSDADVRIFFPEGNSFLNAKGKGTSYRFEQVPRNENIRVIAIKEEEDGYGLAIERTNSRNEDPELNFEKVSMEKLREAMNSLNEL